MPIAFDATANDLESGTTATFSHPCTGSDRLLFVTAVVGSGNTVSGVTYNGVAMTNVPTNSPVSNPSGAVLYLFYLINPATGANNVVVTAAVSDTIRAVSASYTGVKQSGQPDASGNGTASGAASITDSITTVADDCWVIAATSNTVDVATNGTGYVNRGNSAGVGIGDSGAAVAPGSNSQTVNTSGSANWAIIQASIAPVPTATVNNGYFHFM